MPIDGDASPRRLIEEHRPKCGHLRADNLPGNVPKQRVLDVREKQGILFEVLNFPVV